MATHRSIPVAERDADPAPVEDKRYVDMTIEELDQAREELLAEMLDLDSQLAMRRTRPTGNRSVKPMYNYPEWRNETVARKNQIVIDYQLVKSLIAEKSREAHLARTPTSDRDVEWWKRRAGWLQRALESIAYDPAASESTKSRAADVLLKCSEQALGVVDEEAAGAAG